MSQSRRKGKVDRNKVEPDRKTLRPTLEIDSILSDYAYFNSHYHWNLIGDEIKVESKINC